MVTVNVDTLATHGQIRSVNQLNWPGPKSAVTQHCATVQYSANELRKLSLWLCHGDSTVKAYVIININYYWQTMTDNLHDTVDKRRWRFLRLPSARPVSAAVQRTPEGGKRKRGRPRKIWQDTLCDDLQAMDVSWEEARSVAGDRKEWRSLVAQCPAGTGDLSLSKSKTDHVTFIDKFFQQWRPFIEEYISTSQAAVSSDTYEVGNAGLHEVQRGFPASVTHHEVSAACTPDYRSTLQNKHKLCSYLSVAGDALNQIVISQKHILNCVYVWPQTPVENMFLLLLSTAWSTTRTIGNSSSLQGIARWARQDNNNNFLSRWEDGRLYWPWWLFIY